MSKQKLFFALFTSAVSFSACELTPGEGGTSDITGKVYVKEVNGSGIVTAEYFAPDEDVYILFDEDGIFDESTKTSYNGEYQFTFLRKGTYRIFAYSDLNSLSNEKEAVTVEVEITENKQNVEAPLITIEKR
ncbi:MAG: hypothetical protein ACKVPJ_05955 [Chitinophagales bacterium]